MPRPTSEAIRANELRAVSSLAKRFNDSVPDGTPERLVFSAALAFICTHAETSTAREILAELMHAAADELLKGSAGFGLNH